jgi:flagellin-like hook-associated protein FlgL
MSSPKEWDVKMSNINLTAAVRQNLLSLQGTAQMMAKTQNTLSTGNKVNSALDNPSNFFTASSLNSRASDLGNLMDSMKSGIKTIEAADNGLTSITKTLESMQSTLRQARQDKSFETASYTMPSSSSSLTASSAITFKGGAFGTSGAGSVKLKTDSAQALKAVGSDQTHGLSDMADVKAALTETKAKQTSATTVATTGGVATYKDKSFDIEYNGKKATITIKDTDFADAADSTFAELKTAIQKGIDASDLKGQIKVGGATTLELEATSAADASIKVTDAGNVFFDADDLDGTTATANKAGSDGKTSFAVNGVTVNIGAADLSDTAWTAANNDKNVAALAKAVNVQLGNAGSKFKAEAVGDANAQTLRIQADSTSAGALKITGEASKTLFGATDTTAGIAGTEDTSVNLVKTVDDLVNEINNSSTLSTKIKASNDSGKLRIQNLSTQDLTMDGISSSGVIDDTSTGQAKIKGNTVRTDLAKQFNELRDQLDKLADDASFNGINLLRGDKLTITFNETSTSSIAILAKDGKSVDSTSLGVPTTVEAKDLDSDDTIDGVLNKVKSALNSVRSQSSAFGSNLSVVENRQNFTTSMMNTLQTGAGNLTLADMNEEAANMVSLQTRQSLATSSLSMANQANQNVLQLLR